MKKLILTLTVLLFVNTANAETYGSSSDNYKDVETDQIKSMSYLFLDVWKNDVDYKVPTIFAKTIMKKEANKSQMEEICKQISWTFNSNVIVESIMFDQYWCIFDHGEWDKTF